jgi:hypothetical protein
MRRLRRWIFNLAAALSAVLFVVVMVLWPRSCWTGDEIAWHRDNLSYSGDVTSGALSFTNARFSSDFLRDVLGEPDG